MLLDKVVRACAALALTAIAVSCSARSAETRDPNTVVCGWIAEPDSFAPLTQVNTSAGRMIDDLLYT
ncbi:MAG: hypothetical protein M3126_12580, partial [Candidatus Eremiobacteraeota bacterium]|nr:hypothetical protein [Candidatus Eremiobacteraeota bacterium]